jgi:hypothetical protein
MEFIKEKPHEVAFLIISVRFNLYPRIILYLHYPGP